MNLHHGAVRRDRLNPDSENLLPLHVFRRPGPGPHSWTSGSCGCRPYASCRNEAAGPATCNHALQHRESRSVLAERWPAASDQGVFAKPSDGFNPGLSCMKILRVQIETSRDSRRTFPGEPSCSPEVEGFNCPNLDSKSDNAPVNRSQKIHIR